MQADLIAYLAKNQPLFFALLAAPLPLMVALDVWEYWVAKDSGKQQPDTNEFGAILRGIDNVVALKASSIATYAGKVKSARGKRSEALLQIAHPEEQMAEIVEQLYNVFRNITGDDDIKLTLVPIAEGVPTSYAVYMPKDAAPPNNMLKEQPKRTSFFFAARDGMQVIDDIEKYIHLTPRAQREYCASEKEDDKGSLICFPLKHPYWEKVVYVISAKSTVPGTFTHGNKKKYLRICEYFSKRILMEHSLRTIIDNTDP